MVCTLPSIIQSSQSTEGTTNTAVGTKSFDISRNVESRSESKPTERYAEWFSRRKLGTPQVIDVRKWLKKKGPKKQVALPPIKALRFEGSRSRPGSRQYETKNSRRTTPPPPPPLGNWIQRRHDVHRAVQQARTDLLRLEAQQTAADVERERLRTNDLSTYLTSEELKSLQREVREDVRNRAVDFHDIKMSSLPPPILSSREHIRSPQECKKLLAEMSFEADKTADWKHLVVGVRCSLLSQVSSLIPNNFEWMTHLHQIQSNYTCLNPSDVIHNYNIQTNTRMSCISNCLSQVHQATGKNYTLLCHNDIYDTNNTPPTPGYALFRCGSSVVLTITGPENLEILTSEDSISPTLLTLPNSDCDVGDNRIMVHTGLYKAACSVYNIIIDKLKPFIADTQLTITAHGIAGGIATILQRLIMLEKCRSNELQCDVQLYTFGSPNVFYANREVDLEDDFQPILHKNIHQQFTEIHFLLENDIKARLLGSDISRAGPIASQQHIYGLLEVSQEQNTTIQKYLRYPINEYESGTTLGKICLININHKNIASPEADPRQMKNDCTLSLCRLVSRRSRTDYLLSSYCDVLISMLEIHTETPRTILKFKMPGGVCLRNKHSPEQVPDPEVFFSRQPCGLSRESFELQTASSQFSVRFTKVLSEIFHRMSPQYDTSHPEVSDIIPPKKKPETGMDLAAVNAVHSWSSHPVPQYAMIRSVFSGKYKKVGDELPYYNGKILLSEKGWLSYIEDKCYFSFSWVRAMVSTFGYDESTLEKENTVFSTERRYGSPPWPVPIFNASPLTVDANGGLLTEEGESACSILFSTFARPVLESVKHPLLQKDRNCLFNEPVVVRKTAIGLLLGFQDAVACEKFIPIFQSSHNAQLTASLLLKVCSQGIDLVNDCGHVGKSGFTVLFRELCRLDEGSVWGALCKLGIIHSGAQETETYQKLVREINIQTVHDDEQLCKTIPSWENATVRELKRRLRDLWDGRGKPSESPALLPTPPTEHLISPSCCVINDNINEGINLPVFFNSRGLHGGLTAAGLAINDGFVSYNTPPAISHGGYLPDGNIVNEGIHYGM